MSRYGKQRKPIDADLKSFFSCVRRGETGKIKYFVDERGIDINTQDSWGNTPLYLACLCGHPKMVRLLLQKGARYDVGSIEVQRCFLSALTMEIREIMKEHESSCLVMDKHMEYIDFDFFFERLYEQLPGYDIQLITQDQLFLAHRCILCVRCEYFKQRLMDDGATPSDMLQLQDPIFTPVSLRAILQYIYTGRVDITADEKEETKKLASFLGYSKLEEILEVETRKAVISAGKKKEKDVEVTIQHRDLKKQLKTDISKFSTGSVPLALQHTLMVQTQSLVEKRDYFCDICLSVEGHLFDCHKVFFCGRSEFFHTLLIDKQDEQPPAFEDYRPTVNVENVSVQDFVHIVSFIYTDNCLITEENFMSLLKLSELYALPGLKKLIMGKMNKILNVDNAVSVFSGGMEMDNKKLIQESCKFMADNLHEMQTVSSFQDLLYRELGPCDKSGTAGITVNKADHTQSSQFMEHFIYYIRGTAKTYEEKEEANRKITLLNTIVYRQLGYSEKFSLLELPSRIGTAWSDTQPTSKKEDKCVLQ